MRRHSPTRRILVAALAILQMAVPALVAIADANAASRSAGAQVHIEDHTRRACKAVHPDNCALCQFLSFLAPQRASATVVPVAALGPSRGFDDAARLPGAIARTLHRTRAPPVG